MNISNNTTSNPSAYAVEWMNAICKEMNTTTVKMRDGQDWSPDNAVNVVDFFQIHILMNRGIYNYLDDKGLLYTGRCPVYGTSIGKDRSFTLFGRKIYLSSQGVQFAKRHDGKDETGKSTNTTVNHSHTSDETPKVSTFGKIGVFGFWIVLFLFIAKSCV
ncbi:hypothetical protein [Neolewinella maritima]|uniref:hypothetical protein n=1 Tax=Neolewinella maritima TaxID=1383882 RepID=UPI001EE7C771|nr:hypothetical protein [Neolewinella maritima]